MKTWWGNLPLHIKLNIPIQLVLLMLLPVAHFWVMSKYESAVMDDVRQRTQDSAIQSMLALNSMMLTGTISNQTARAVFQKKMSVLDGVEDFHLVRTSAVQTQLGAGLELEQQADDLDRLAAESRTVQTNISHNGMHTLRVVVPFKAQSDFFGTNCMQCHHVPEGTVLGTISLKINLEPEYGKMRQLSLLLLVGQLFLQFFFFFLIGWLIRSVTKSVVDLESAMRHVNESEDFSIRADVQGHDEIGKMAQVFNGLVAHIEDLHLRLDEKIADLEDYYDNTEEELRIGSVIMSRITDAQSTLDPSVRMQINPVTHYSGDIILVSRTPTDTLHIMLADAVGHGLIAAMNLLPLSQIFKAMTRKGFSILRIAEELNSTIHRLMPTDRFIGAVLVSINFREHVIEVWNGGVPAPLLLSAKGLVLHEWKSRNLPLGILNENEFRSEAEVFHYEDNSQLFIFSDGLIEAESPEGKQFGKERIRELLRNTKRDLRFDVLMSSLEDHLGGHSAHDDVSLLVASLFPDEVPESHPQHLFSFHDDTASSSDWRVAITLGADELKYLDVVSLVAQIVNQIHANAEHYSQLYVILSELFNNALDHGILRLDSAIKQDIDGFEKFLRLREIGLRSLSAGSIEINVEKVVVGGHNGIRIHVVDSGNGFDYSTFQDASMEPDVHDLHGRGIALVRSMAYKLEYTGSGNEVTAYYVFD